MKTQRLYHDDPGARTFEAEVVDVRPGPGGTVEVVLDRTAFYPTGGGQPHDLGFLGGRRVLEVEEEADLVVHRLQGGAPAGTVKGEVDWERRLDHRRQHTGQHILSRAFVDLAGADTVGFHLGAERCSVDLNRGDLDAGVLHAVEGLANETVLADVPVETTWYGNAAAVPPGVRKEAAVEGPVRVVAVGAFDATPCCGTHCGRSGEVGLIKILRAERKKGGLRVEFVCGGRALADYGRRHHALRDAARAFTTEEFEVPERVAALQAEAKETRHRLERAEKELRERLAVEWAAAPEPGPFTRDLGAGREAWLAPMASDLAGRRGCPVLLTSEAPEGVRIALAVPDGGGHAGRLLKTLLEAHGGKGGGSKRLAQGRVDRSARAGMLSDWTGRPPAPAEQEEDS